MVRVRGLAECGGIVKKDAAELIKHEMTKPICMQRPSQSHTFNQSLGHKLCDTLWVLAHDSRKGAVWTFHV